MSPHMAALEAERFAPTRFGTDVADHAEHRADNKRRLKAAERYLRKEETS